MVEGDDLGGAALEAPAPLAGELDGAFIGFGAGIREEDPLEARVPGEEARQPQRRFVASLSSVISRGVIHRSQLPGRSVTYALKNASSSSLTWCFSVVHMPCGAPL